MFVRSTGLGRTLLRGRIAIVESTTLVPSTLEPPAEGTSEPMRMLMAMEILHPVHWTVRAFLDPSDLRHMIGLILKNPMLILRAIKFLLSKDPVYQSLEATETSAPAATGATGPKPVPPRGQGSAAAKTGPGPIPARPGPGPIPSR
jgi:hypothetical protein